MELEKRLIGVIPDSPVYRVTGYYINRMAGLEYVVDQFLFAFAKEVRGSTVLASRRSFPIKMADKIDLIALAYVMVPKLRSCGDADDFLSINSIVLGLEEVWSARNILVHGKIHFSETTDESFYIRTHQFERVAKNEYRHAEYKIGLGAILVLLDRARYLEALLRDGIRVLSGTDTRKEQERLRRERARGRELKADLESWGYRIDYSGSWLSDRDAS